MKTIFMNALFALNYLQKELDVTLRNVGHVSMTIVTDDSPAIIERHVLAARLTGLTKTDFK